MEVGDRVDELGPSSVALQRIEGGLQLVDAHAVAVHGDLYDVGLVGAEGRHRTRVGRTFGDDHVAGVDQRLAHEIDDLLAARGDEHLVGLDGHPLSVHDLHDALLDQ